MRSPDAPSFVAIEAMLGAIAVVFCLYFIAKRERVFSAVFLLAAAVCFGFAIVIAVDGL
jgi:hypothetical protein